VYEQVCVSVVRKTETIN